MDRAPGVQGWWPHGGGAAVGTDRIAVVGAAAGPAGLGRWRPADVRRQVTLRWAWRARDGLSRLITGFFVFVFYLINRGGC